MAQDDGQERTEEPTAKREREAKEKGQVPRSRELNTMVMLMTAASAFLMFGDSLGKQLLTILHDGFSLDRTLAFDKTAMLNAVVNLFANALWMLVPLFALLVVAALAPPFMIGGWSFSIKAVSPKWDKLDPLKGFKRIFGWQGLVELFKALAKFSIVAIVLVLLIWNQSEAFFGLGNEPVKEALVHAAALVAWAFLALSAALVLITGIDLPFQLWNHRRQLKMTRQEIKDEYKETEGKPEVKARVRQMQMEIAQRRMLEEVPKADVVVTNPTHYAVALRYDQENEGAPMVVAKGIDFMAAKIRSIAIENNVPLLAAPPLARSLYYSTDLGDEIPTELYVAVAQVLAYVFQLKVILRRGGVAPPPPGDLPIPETFMREHNGPEQPGPEQPGPEQPGPEQPAPGQPGPG